PLVTLILAIQLVGFLGVLMVLPVVLARTADVDQRTTVGMVSATMLTAGLGVLLQVVRSRWFGSGLLAPTGTTGAALPAILIALNRGGLELVFGMAWIIGATQIAMGPAVRWLRRLCPVEIAGLAVLLIGLGLGILGVRNFFTTDHTAPGAHHPQLIGLVTLSVMVGLHVWTKGYPHLFCALAGLLVGLVLSFALGAIDQAALDKVDSFDWFSVPGIPALNGPLTFDAALVLPFVITGIALSFHSFGAIVTGQRAADANWRRPGLDSVSGGILAEGVTNLVGSLLHGMTQTVNGGAIGLAAASGALSRRIGLFMAGLFVLLAFVPKVAGLWSVLPEPVIGAALIFCASFVVVGGLRTITSRALDARKVLVLGLALILGLSRDIIPEYYRALPDVAQMWLMSSLAQALLVAILLNALFRIGIGKRAMATLPASLDMLETADTFMRDQGAMWGAGQVTVIRARQAGAELIEHLIASGVVAPSVGHAGPEPGILDLKTRFDEFQFKLIVRYRGQAIDLSPRQPAPEDTVDHLEPEDVVGMMIRRLANKVKISERGDVHEIRLIFND
ncbi:MAG: solute carrier family 23 protein, partial [Ferrovibrionaceae bacterium]